MTEAWQRDIDRLERQVNDIDTHGGRMAMVLSAQVAQLTRDIKALNRDVRAQLNQHRAEHVAEAAHRRKVFWRVTGLCIALLTLIDGPLIALFQVNH